MNIAILHPQCHTPGRAIKMALLTAQSLQNQGHNVRLYTFDHDDHCFPELQKGLTIVTVKTTKRGKMKNEGGKMNNEGNQPVNNQLNQSIEDKIGKARVVDTLVKLPSFWSMFQTVFPGLFPLVSIAWDSRHVDIVIANGPPMQVVAVMARLFSVFSHFHQRLHVVWWHHHVPWYYTGGQIAQKQKREKGFIGLKSWFERRFVIPRVQQHISTSYYTAFCLEKYCGKKSIVIHPVMVMTVEDLLRSSPKRPMKNIQHEDSSSLTFDDNSIAGTDSRHPELDSGSRTNTPSDNKEPLSSPGSSFTTLRRTQSRIAPFPANAMERLARDDGKTRPVALFSHGKLEPGKGLDTLVKLWKELRNNPGVKDAQTPGLHVKLIIAGDGSMKTWLQEQGVTVIPYREGLLTDLAKSDTDILALYLSTIDAFGMTPVEAQIAGLPTIILDREGARETVLLDNDKQPLAQLVAQESEITPLITNFIQYRTFQQTMTNVNFCHHKEYFSLSRLDSDIQSLIASLG